MTTSLPGEADWNGTVCAGHLTGNGYLQQSDAAQAVAWLEEEGSRLLAGRGGGAEAARSTDLEVAFLY